MFVNMLFGCLVVFGFLVCWYGFFYIYDIFPVVLVIEMNIIFGVVIFITIILFCLWDFRGFIFFGFGSVMVQVEFSLTPLSRLYCWMNLIYRACLWIRKLP